MPPALRLVAPDSLPHVWRVPDLARVEEEVISTGHDVLDRELPGCGWPIGCLIEILQDVSGAHDWQLTLPALAGALGKAGGPVVLVEPPWLPFGPSLQAQGLPLSRLLRLHASRPASRLWAAEQSIRCADVAAVMAWLPNTRAADLRRLHLGAAQHRKLLFVFREAAVHAEASPARLRLLVDGGEALKLRILKRRGPPLERSLELKPHPERLSQLLDSRKGAPANTILLPKERSHVLDRTLSLA